MTLSSFTFTDRARPIVEIGLGDTHGVGGPSVWDGAHWDTSDAHWAGGEPVWVDISCDCYSYDCQTGRGSTIDRFVAGSATVNFDNTSGWADPSHDVTPGELSMRPGRQIRLGVWHAELGTVWLWRGYIDAITPIYDPTEPDTVELSCIDALGEVNRAKTVPLPEAGFDGEAASDRVHRLLDAAMWSTPKRDIWPSADALTATDLGGQTADLLGQVADSVGGAVFADTTGTICFRPRDWQVFNPATAPDATIGNVSTGVAQVDGYLTPTIGYVTTPDTAADYVDGNIRVRAKVRADSLPSAAAAIAMQRNTANTDIAWDWRIGTAGQLAARLSNNGTALQVSGNAHPSGTIVAGTDRWLGFRFERPGAAAVVTGETSSDQGATWTNASTFNLAGMFLPFDSTAPISLGQLVSGGATLPGRIYWAQMEAINRARLVFPGVAGNYQTIPDAAPLRVTGDIEIVARLAPTDWTPAALSTVVGRYNTFPTAQRCYLLRVTTSGGLQLTTTPDGTAAANAISTAAVGAADGTLRWVKVTRVAATGVVQFFTAPDAPTEPTTWTKLGADVATTAGGIFAGTAPLSIAAYETGGTSGMFAGRIARVIVRNGIAGPTVLDVSENNAGTMATGTTFAATSGQTVTVTQTAGNTIVQPQPDSVVWRFDANDYPGTGLSYVDPRGRTWTLSAAGAITPKVPAIPADVCPVRWERPFERADISTRVIMGRDPATAVQVDDDDGIIRYGIEPFQRTDLINTSDAAIAALAHRVLITRNAATAPRIRSVALDAATTDASLDLQTTVDLFTPSRYRCRLIEDRGLVFDDEYFATGLRHSIDPSTWETLINLDVAAPYANRGNRWDTARWDQAIWTDLVTGRAIHA